MENKTEIIEGNKLIANSPFASDIHKIWMAKAVKSGTLDLFYEACKYHSSWDWLMPVIERISLYQYDDKSWEGCPPYNDYAWPRTFGMISETGKYLFRFNAQPLFEADKLIDAAFQAVVYFIQNSTNE